MAKNPHFQFNIYEVEWRTLLSLRATQWISLQKEIAPKISSKLQ